MSDQRIAAVTAAIAEAGADHFWRDRDLEFIAEILVAAYDAAHPQPEPEQEVKTEDDNAAAPLAGADPPWLDGAIRVFDETARISSTTAALRAALRFAVRQPRPITEKFVKDFADELGQTEMGLYSHDDIHHALEAAEAERARGDD